jgi:hypothetical protein
MVPFQSGLLTLKHYWSAGKRANRMSTTYGRAQLILAMSCDLSESSLSAKNSHHLHGNSAACMILDLTLEPTHRPETIPQPWGLTRTGNWRIVRIPLQVSRLRVDSCGSKHPQTPVQCGVGTKYGHGQCLPFGQRPMVIARRQNPKTHTSGCKMLAHPPMISRMLTLEKSLFKLYLFLSRRTDSKFSTCNEYNLFRDVTKIAMSV